MLLSVANSRIPRNIETAKASGLFPETINENAGLFISFIEKYYEYINSIGLPSRELSSITSDKDIDRASNEYLTQIQSLIARNVPESTILDKTSLYRIILQYYRTRGSEDSIYAFFKLFFDEMITIFYPRDYLFELSQGSGEWRDVDFSLVRTVEGNPNKTRMRITSNIEVGPRGFNLNPNVVELIYFNETTWTYFGNEINPHFPYLTKVQIWSGEYRWKFEYKKQLGDNQNISEDIIVYSDNDTVWPDEASWSAFERDIYYRGNSVKQLQYDTGNTWSPIGDHIEGDEINSILGNSVSLSADGARLAIGSSYMIDDDLEQGHSRVYQFEKQSLSWIQIGQDLTANLANKNISYNLLLSSDGNRVVVTAADPVSYDIGIDYGNTRVYTYINGLNRWQQIGETLSPSNFFARGDFVNQLDKNFIVEETVSSKPLYNASFVTEGGISNGNINTFRGTRTAFSGDGSTVAITYLFITSVTLIYKYNSELKSWLELGGNIYGEEANDYTGYSMSLNHDGTILVMGAPHYDTDSGKVIVYRYNTNVNSWQLYGNKLTPSGNAGDEYGFSVSLNSSGNILAIGAIGGYNDENVSTGYTIIYRYESSSNTWEQLGQTLYGDNEGDFGGYSVALNSEGNICAIGYHSYDNYGYYNYGNSVVDSGIVKIYKYSNGTWLQLSNSIEGQFSLDNIGSALSISSDGFTVAVGSVGENAGVHVYSLDAIQDFKFTNIIEVSAIPEFAFAYGEIINSLENFSTTASNTLYKTINLTPIVWQQTNEIKRWVPNDHKSFASDAYKLHDGYYWQKYSYDIKTSKPVAEWLDEYLKFIHPAGLQLFASILLQLLSTRYWKDKIDYSANRPQLNFSWITNQRAPFGAHSPQYQPGWLTFNDRLINVFAAALRINENDRNLYNLVYYIFNYYFINQNFRDKSVRKEYQNWIKFLDPGQIISGYLNKTVSQANEEYSFNNICKFSNVSTHVELLSDGRYLENTDPRNLETRVMREVEENSNPSYKIILLENGAELLLENSRRLLTENYK